MSSFDDAQERQKTKKLERLFSIHDSETVSDEENDKDKLEVFVIEVDERKKERLTKSGIAWQRAFDKAVIQNQHETIDENVTTNDDVADVPLISKTNGDTVSNTFPVPSMPVTSNGTKDSLVIESRNPIGREQTVDSKKSSKSGKSVNQNDETDDIPHSIIPTKGQKGALLDKLYDDFDLKYTSGRRYCGVYLPTMGTAFDPKSAEDLYQRYVFRERLGSVLTTAIIELLMRMVSFVLILAVSKHWDHASCWILILTSMMDTVAIILIVRARATERKAPFRLLQLSSLIIYSSMLMVVIGIMFIPYTDVYKTDITFPVWYVMYAVFTCYTMLAVREDHALYGAIFLTVVHLVVRLVTIEFSTNWQRELAVIILVFLTTHIVGVFNRYLVERAQRETFMETRRLFRHCLKHEREYQSQHRLILSAIPRFIALKMVNDASVHDNSDDIMPDKSTMNTSRKYIHRFNNVTMLYADIKGFTALSTVLTSEHLVRTLNGLFAEFDKAADKHGCTRIRILGDCYYCVSGLPEASRPDHASCCIKMGLSMIETIKETRAHTGKDVDMRIGIHTGAVLTGVLGLRKFQFDIFSTDTVIANNMESSGKAGRCHISGATLEHLQGEYEVETGTPNSFLEEHNIKTYFIKAPKELKLSEDATETSTALQDISTMSLLPLPLAPIIQRHSDFDEVSRRLEISIRNGTHTAIGKSKISERTVTFKENSLEVDFRRLHDEFFKTNLFVSLFVGLVLLICQFLVTGYKELMLLVYIGVFLYIIFFFIALAFTLDYKKCPQIIRSVNRSLNRSQSLRHIVIFSSILLNTFLGLSGTMTCAGFPKYSVGCNETELVFKGQINTNYTPSMSTPFTPVDYSNTICETPQFIELYGLLVILSCASFLRFYHLLRLGTLSSITFVFSVMMMFTYQKLFFDWEANLVDSKAQCLKEESVPQMLINLLMMILLATTQFFEGRQNDWTTRMDYLRKIQAQKEIAEMEDLKRQTYMLLLNMLPEHVADHFLSRPTDSDELYSQSYDCTSVIFASIPGFSTYYQETEAIDGQGLECLRMLNEIISSIDDLLNQERFHCIEKIKTIGATYMACSGLSPEAEEEDSVNNLCSTAHFALALKILVGQFNKRYDRKFQMRIGLAYGGPVIAGVIGSKKPQYDIWGKTVNLAARMDTTGDEGKIQCPEEVMEPLQKRGFNFQQRGETYVKGFKNKISTYWLTGCTTAAIRYHGKASVTKKQSMNLARLVFDVVKKKGDE